MEENALQSGKLRGFLKSKINLTGSFSVPEKIYVSNSDYDGEYDITPTLSDQILLTKNKTLDNDILVKAISPNVGTQVGYISSIDTPCAIEYGFHDGNGTVSISEDEKAKIIPSNIRDGVTLLGVEGNMRAGTESATSQEKEVTPTFAEQTILPDTDLGISFLSKVKVKAIPVTRTPNAFGGITVQIG
jgi:hypothetical protein